MKIYPDLTKLWGKKIREAGMTKNQAKKVLDESDKTQKAAQEFIETPPSNKSQKTSVQELLKKLNTF